MGWMAPCSAPIWIRILILIVAEQPPDGISVPKRRSPAGDPSVGEISTIGIDIAKQVFQLHGVDGARDVVLSRRLRRGQVAGFFAALQPCLLSIKACGTRTSGRERSPRSGMTCARCRPATSSRI
jgi:hypothetical protein